jgi:CRP-like cAMP-binding protein
MERKEYEAGSFLCKRNQLADECYLIQSGVVDIQTTYAKNSASPFIIERLIRGSVINHRSFIVKDEIDTDYRCKDRVSVFCLKF